MSNEVESRVVEMRFDNAHFESNVKTSMSTLEKLKSSLRLDGATKGFEGISAAAKKCDLNPLSKGVEVVHAKFSALQVMGVTALANITNSAVNAGKNIVKSFTLEPVIAGYKEYETQINSVQTILANTQHQGTNLEQVNKALDELNKYADQTIYNFTEMTRNIGTFTAAGVDLQTSVDSIKGIANLAAVSGSTSQQASTAMYQLSQALAAGKVSLMDWNSVVNAGMGGKVFQDALIRTSELLGTGAKSAIDMYGSFRESLTKGEWLTTEVLTETLKQFAGSYDKAELIQQGFTEAQAEDIMKMAQTASDAATKVKTFTQLMDTLKESVQSGWTQTWELLIGDFEEGKTLWTNLSNYLGDIIAKTSDARNDLLSGWKNLHGRDMAIEAISYAFNGLLSVIKPIKEAFREIFPPVTVSQLMRLTAAIRNFTQHLILTEEQSSMLKDAFTGIFSIIKTGINIFIQLGSAVAKILSNFKGLGNSILEAASAIGNWLTGISESAKNTDIFGGAVDVINKALQFIIDKFKNIKPAITDFIKGFSEVSGKIIPKAIGVFENLGSVVAKIGDVLKSAFGKIKDIGANIASSINDMTAFDSFVKVLKNVWDFVKKACSGIVDAFSEIIRNGDLKAGLDTFNSGVIAAILLGVKKMLNIEDSFDGLTGGVFDQIKSVFSGLTGMFDSVQESLQAWQQNLNADTLKKIATAIGILAVSLIGLAMVKPEKLTGAIVAITTLFGELVGSMAILNKIGSFDKSFGTASNTMVKMAAAVLILSFALAKVGQLDWDQMIKGLVGVTILLGEVVGASILLSTYGGKVKSCGKQMILIAIAMEIFADVCSKFGKMSWETILKGVSGIGLILLEFVGFQKLLSMIKPKKMISSATSFVIIGAAMEIFADVCSKFGAMEWGDLGKAGVAMLGILALAAGFGLLAGLSKGMVGSSIALVIIAAGLEIMADVSSKLGSMSWEALAKAGVGIAGILALAAGFGLLAGLAPGMIASSIALLIMSGAMELMADVCSKFGAMDWEALGKSGVAIAGILALAIGFGALAGFAPGMITASAALLIMAAALSVLAPVMVLLGSMSWESIIKGLVVVAGAFGILGLAGLLLQPLIPAILGLSAAIALLGIGCLACGAGIALLATGLATLAVGGGAGIAALIAVIVELINLIPFIVQKVGEALVLLIQVIAESAPMLIDAIVQIGLALLQALTQLLPPLLDFIIFAIMELLRVLGENTLPIVEQVVAIVVDIIAALRNKVGDVVQVITDLIIAIVNALGDSYMQLSQAGVDLIINLIDGLANGIEENTPRIKEALVHLGEAILNAFCEFFGIHSPSTVFADVGGYLIQGLINGVGSFISSAVGKVRELGTQMLNTIKTKVSEFRSKGAELMTKLRDGIKSKVTAVKTAVTKLGTDILSTVKGKIEDFKTAGKNMIDGLKEGIKNAASNAVEAAKGVASSALEGAKKLLGIHSPSREFFKIGEFTVEGLANGIKKNSKLSDKAAEKLAQGLIDSVESTTKSMTYGSGAMKAYLKQYNTFTNSINDNDKIVKSASKSIQNYIKKLYEESDQYEKDTEALKEHKDELSKLQAKRESIKATGTENELSSIDNQIEQMKNKIIEDENAILQHTEDTFNKVRDTIKNSIQKSTDIMSTSLDTGVDLFSAFDGGSEITSAEALSNMESQLDGVSKWKKNLERLADKGLDEGLIKELEAKGVSGSSLVSAYATMSKKEIDKANKLYAKYGSMTAETFMDNYKQQIQDSEAWSEDIQKLVEKGFDQGIIETIGEAGIDGGSAYIDAFLNMSDSDVKNLNDYYKKTLTLPDDVADSIIASYAKAGEDADKAFTDSAANKDTDKKFNDAKAITSAGMKTVLTSASSYITNKKTGTTTKSTNTSSANTAQKASSNVSIESVEEINKTQPEWNKAAKNLIQGFINGIIEDTPLAVNAVKNMASSINTALNTTVDTNLSVRPVVTMDTESLTVMTNLNTTITNSVDSLTQVITGMETRIEASNNAVINAINGLRSDVSALLSGDAQEIALYVDSKKLASSLAKPMDRELNILSKRGAY